jgi:hypothetical protein
LPYSVVASKQGKSRTCGQSRCVGQLRSQIQRKHPFWANPKICERPGCTNRLEPNRRISKQNKYCSSRCSALHRTSRKKQLLNVTPNRGGNPRL